MFKFIKQSRYQLGWADQHWADVTGQQRTMFSPFSLEDVDNLGVLRLYNDPRIDELIRGRTPVQQVVNLAEPGSVFTPHTHPGWETFLYYCNYRWSPEWAGETIIFSENDFEAEHAISVKPGRVLWMDEGVMHSVRGPSNACPEYRFTFSAFFSVDD